MTDGPPDQQQLGAKGDRSLRGVGAAAVVLGAVTVVVGSFLPWVISGSVGRSSFATVRSADRLGLVPDGVAVALLRSWYLVPLGAAIVTLLLVSGLRRLAALVGLALGALTTMVASVVIVVSPSTGPGPAVSVAGGVVLAAGGFATLLDPRRGRHRGSPRRMP